MAKSKKIKIFIGLFYFFLVSLFLYFIFTNYSFQEITSYEFIKNNQNYFKELRKSNLYILAILFILFSIAWVFAAGFGSPLALVAGFIFGKWFGLLFVVIGMSFGATLLYIFANYFLKEIIRDKFLNKFKKLEEKFKKSEFTYLLIYRFIGGIPFQIQNIIPCIFNVKITNFFWSTFLGIMPSLFLLTSIASGLEKIIENNLTAPSVYQIISTPSVFIPLVAFLILFILLIIIRKFFFKN
tara:strand:+ start:47 stop:766 length:720 start_codon:yes stop_codon:yes gene_type:complete